MCTSKITNKKTLTNVKTEFGSLFRNDGGDSFSTFLSHHQVSKISGSGQSQMDSETFEKWPFLWWVPPIRYTSNGERHKYCHVTIGGCSFRMGEFLSRQQSNWSVYDSGNIRLCLLIFTITHMLLPITQLQWKTDLLCMTMTQKGGIDLGWGGSMNYTSPATSMAVPSQDNHI